MAFVAVFLAYETRKLLLGESADRSTVQNIRQLVEDEPGVKRAGQPYTMHLGPDEILLNLQLQFRSGLNAEEVASTVESVERRIRDKHPNVKRIFIEAESIVSTHIAGNAESE